MMAPQSALTNRQRARVKKLRVRLTAMLRTYKSLDHKTEKIAAELNVIAKTAPRHSTVERTIDRMHTHFCIDCARPVLAGVLDTSVTMLRPPGAEAANKLCCLLEKERRKRDEGEWASTRVDREANREQGAMLMAEMTKKDIAQVKEEYAALFALHDEEEAADQAKKESCAVCREPFGNGAPTLRFHYRLYEYRAPTRYDRCWCDRAPPDAANVAYRKRWDRERKKQ